MNQLKLIPGDRGSVQETNDSLWAQTRAYCEQLGLGAEDVLKLVRDEQRRQAILAQQQLPLFGPPSIL